MKVVGKVKVVDQLVSGQSSNGNDWERQLVVVETMDVEPKMLAVDFMGVRKTKVTKTLKVGDVVEVSFVINCREFQDKWYTKLDGLGIAKLQSAAAGEQQTMEMPPAQEPVQEPVQDELPY